MSWLRNAFLAGAALIPGALVADPGKSSDDDLRDLRGRVEELTRDFESDLLLLEEPRENRGEGERRMRFEQEERRRMEDERGRRPEPGRPGMTGPEDMEFELKMRAREIHRQIENLKFELETIELRLQHMRGRGHERREEPQGREGRAEMQRGEDMKRAMAELHARLEEAERSGDREMARRIREKMQTLEPGRAVKPPVAEGPENRARLKAVLAEMEQHLQRAKEEGREEEARAILEKLQQLRKSLGAPDKGHPEENRGRLKAAVEELRAAAEKARAAGDHERARELAEKAEHVMRQLTEEHGRNVEDKRGDAVRKLEQRLVELEKLMVDAKQRGARDEARKVQEELEKVRGMLEKVRQDREEKPREPKKNKPRMI